MWAGSKTREGENNRDGGRKEGEREKKKKNERKKERKGEEFLGSVWRRFSRLRDVSLKRDGGRERESEEEGETSFGDCVAGVPLMSP